MAADRDALRDSYYDLSKTTEHLETPLLQHPADVGDAASALRWMGQKVSRLLAGESVSRPLVVHARDLPLEAEIDLLVYKLYGLSWAEVKIVDPEFGMSEEAYNKYIL